MSLGTSTVPPAPSIMAFETVTATATDALVPTALVTASGMTAAPPDRSDATVIGAAAGGGAVGLLLFVMLAAYVCRGRSRRQTGGAELREPVSSSTMPRSEYGAAPPAAVLQAHAYANPTVSFDTYDSVDSVRIVPE